MIKSTARTGRVFGIILTALVGLYILNVEEPVVVILVHSSPSLNKATNFELKRAIARTWAKDVEDMGASVFFVGEHEGETVMRRPSEFQGRAQSLSRFGPGSSSAKAGAGVAGGVGEGSEYSKEVPLRKMLIPSILENGRADGASGLLKAYYFLYNNTNWYAGPTFQTYPFVLTTDTTHYIHVENLVSTLLSSRPRRLLTMKDDLAFSGAVSEASECSADDFGDRAPPTSATPQNGDNNIAQAHAHWTLSRTHLVSKQLIAMVGPHLHRCVNETAASLMDSGEAFQSCVKEWTSNPLFWKGGYCGRLAALRYQAPSFGSLLGSSAAAYPLRSNFASRKERRGSSLTPQEFEELYRQKQQEQTLEQERQQKEMEKEGQRLVRDRNGEPLKNEDQTERKQQLVQRADDQESEDSRRLLQQLTSSSGSGSAVRWIVGTGLTQPEDFTLIYQSLVAREQVEDEDEEYPEDIDY
ncbi:hypothetical protein BGZ50_002323 [Haplosporangium sp. Z 11]|nr:hypothetical protein BGZ50_002323 [Haplosporangium sp. Z 11]